MSDKEKRYTNGIFIKAVKTQYGQLLNVSFSEGGLQELSDNKNNKGYTNITIFERKEADKHGNTHYATYNDFTPADKPQPEKETESEDLPF